MYKIEQDQQGLWNGPRNKHTNRTRNDTTDRTTHWPGADKGKKGMCGSGGVTQAFAKAVKPLNRETLESVPRPMEFVSLFCKANWCGSENKTFFEKLTKQGILSSMAEA